MAPYMNYPAGTKEVASGPEAVGALAGKFFHKVSARDDGCAEFDPAFANRIGEAVQSVYKGPPHGSRGHVPAQDMPQQG